MRAYKNKQELSDEITKRAELFIGEFDDMSEARKDTLVDGVDRTPAQMIAYQLGWMRFCLSGEKKRIAACWCRRHMVTIDGITWVDCIRAFMMHTKAIVCKNCVVIFRKQ